MQMTLLLERPDRWNQWTFCVVVSLPAAPFYIESDMNHVVKLTMNA